MSSQMEEIKLEVPDDVFVSMNLDKKQFTEEVKKILAFYLFSQGSLSSGKAAKLAGMNRVDFLLEAGKRKINWLPYGEEELKRELQPYESDL